MTFLDPLRKLCSSCEHWHAHTQTHKDGYLQAICQQPNDPRDQHYKRGSDYCQHWKKKPQS